MKYANYFGVAAALGLLGSCFLPWVYIHSLQLTLSGTNGKVTDLLDFGKQVYSQAFFASVMLVLFLMPQVGAKRANILIGAIQFSWAVKNYIVFSMCREGECPEKLAGMYVMIICSSLMLIMSVLPKGNLRIRK